MSVAVIAEKPSVARDLAEVLGADRRGEGVFTGNGYVVTYAVGHLVGLAEPHQIRPDWKRWQRHTLPMLPREWPLVVLPETREQFEVVRRVLDDPKVTEVVCATDAGREGELIFRYVYEAAGCRKPVRRLWISSLTEGAIQEGFEKLRDGRVFDPLADAARGRSQADWLVGMNLSRHYGLAFDEPLSVGRVQTPTLAMVVERELAIRNFVPQDYLEVVATFSPQPGVSYEGTWFKQPAPGEKPPEQPRRLPKDGREAEAIVARAKRGQAAILSVESETKRMLAPLLYDLTELQRHANRLFGFSAQRTLDAAQALYERHKLISYPRTDSRHLSQAIAGTLPQVVRAIEGQYQGLLAPGTGTRPLSRRFVDDAKVSDHHAIIPTDKSAEGKVLGSDERRIYDLICRRLLQAWHGDYVWAATTVITEIRQADGPEVDAFHSAGSAVKEPGWKVLDLGGGKKPPKARGEAKKDDEAQDGDDEQALPSGLRDGQPQQVLDAKAVPKKTRPPPRLTEGALLTAMETAGKALDEKELSEAMRESGLGTPATRAATIETLLARGYLVRNGKTLEATEKGIRLIEVVDPDVKSPVMTGQWEARLQRIERGSGDLPSFMADIEAYVRDVVGRLPPQVPPRPAPFPPRSGAGMGGAPPSPGPASRGGRAVGGRATLSPARVPPPSSAAPPSSHGQLSLLPNSFSRAPSPARVPPPNEAWPPRSAAAPARAQPRSAPHGPLFAEPPPPLFAEPPPPPPPVPERAPVRAPPRSVTPPEGLGALLKSRFGFGSFRPHQEAVCRAATEGRDVLLVMPTGAGKSLCYQLPGLARGGTTLVVSPLIALMEDQVAKLRALGLNAERIHSGRDRSASRKVCADYLAGELDYLFIAPERLGVPGFPELLAKRTPSLVAIDEAHCISQWGHDFRPDYRLLGGRLPMLRPAPIVALTATATPIVQRDIMEQLGLDSGQTFIHGFRRVNLAVEVMELAPSERAAAALRILSEKGRRPAICYASTRKSAEALAQALGEAFPTAAYHAGMSASARDEVQAAFLGGRLEVVVATVAFGMGVDKADVRTVIHTALPSSVEGYYQEIGRAGRDGKPSRAVLLHSFADRRTHEFFLERDYPDASVLQQIWGALTDEPVAKETVRRRLRLDEELLDKAVEKLWVHGGAEVSPEEDIRRGPGEWKGPYLAQRQRKVEQLTQMARFAESHGCRMLHLVQHFGDREDSGTACGLCDVCAPADCVAVRFEAPNEEEAEALGRIMRALGELDGQATGKLCRQLLGEEPEHRRTFERLLAGLVRAGWIRLVEDSFEKEGQRVSFLRAHLTASGRTWGGSVSEHVRLLREAEEEPRGRKKRRGKGGKGAAGESGGTKRRRAKGRKREPVERRDTEEFLEAAGNPRLVEALRSWRLDEAKRRRVPAFRILTNRALAAIAESKPRSQEELLGVHGIGPKLAEKYGRLLVAICARTG